MEINSIMKRKVATRIQNSPLNATALDFLVQRYTYLDRTSWRHQFEQARILLNGSRATPETLIQNGDYMEFTFDNFQEPLVDKKFSVIFEDQDLLVVNKSGNLPCHPAGRYFNNTLWGMLNDRQAGQQLHFINRLDRETSGLVMIAKNQTTAFRLRKRLNCGRIYKIYLAVVEGVFPYFSLRATGVLLRDKKSLIRKKMKFEPTSQNIGCGTLGKICITNIRKLVVKKEMSLTEVVTETGGHHQIRATFQAIGFPIVGDKLYGVDEKLFIKFIEDRFTAEDRAALKMHRQALHAWKLIIPHPVTGSELELEAPVPKDINTVFPMTKNYLP
jgi:23S rRNA pseudouridine955/2504/2580 synthase/23S rRNA pseudouridine1911/1915/1917 synthase